MLDIEVVVAPTQTGLDIVSLAEMKKHLRIVGSGLDDQITSALNEVVAKLDGPGGELNRSLRPVTLRRYLRKFPTGNIISLPYPPLRSVTEVVYEDSVASSPLPALDTANYIVRTGSYIGQIELLPGESWPSVADHPRAVCITYDAGYTTYPDQLKRLVKILAAHYIESPDATINDRMQSMVSRKVEFGVEDLRAALRVSPSYDDFLDD